MKVLMTGASSFTGCHIARAILAAGHELVCVMTRSSTDYNDEMSRKRLALIAEGAGGREAGNVKFIYEASFGDENFLEAIAEFKPNVFINHGASIKGYRKPDFDIAKSVEASTMNLDKVCAALSKVGCQRVIHSGTVFEPVDGLEAFSPYGESKTLVAKRVFDECQKHDLAMSKIYIPNPVGAYENEDRLIPFFVQKWKSGEKPSMNAPRLTWDNIPAPWLADFYVEELSAKAMISERRPSGFKITLKEFVDRFTSEARARGVSDNLEFDVEDKTTPGNERVNSEPHASLGTRDGEAKFFDEWIQSHWAQAKKLREISSGQG